ncbi:hypothetical protein [Clostridium beijerinckii]|uniref:Phage protein n=1 Tax=Clostridium beijerinckii TaxID=1520 RepID=A0AAX0B745_CLOBE|nr:hypothetical protein [Clostridium beijerinckii]MBA8932500.1 hypothetical protein [Clostridium beijerinckii]NRT37538.1 hypothetical protein [Clostridium beijerinckii]NRT48720.1 hypothetical protein [Clostridium beijerinckii]NRT90762.1 hypothetical protein [Clostridium beijerinckii]NRU36704.1 hypothetical protein [Clostridium beijerinckii]
MIELTIKEQMDLNGGAGEFYYEIDDATTGKEYDYNYRDEDAAYRLYKRLQRIGDSVTISKVYY